ncbi:hypothetical protein ABEB36_004810 [Hypothenemus hampei]|uniref:BED-type domain-containing protein n=1 Tax=Hypothenemus hampei TaxID=57062 RepID=A0ABD1EWX3_HYPHA
MADETEIESELQEPTQRKRKKVQKKKVTDYFCVEQDPTSQKKTDKQGKCTLCTTKNIILKMKNCGTSSLRRHLQSQHSTVFKENFESEKASISTESESSSRNDSILGWLSGTIDVNEQVQGTFGTNASYQEAFQKLLVEYVIKKISSV